MKLLRRWLMTLLADDICALTQAALDDAEIRTFLDGEEIAGIARREIDKHARAVRASFIGKD